MCSTVSSGLHESQAQMRGQLPVADCLAPCILELGNTGFYPSLTGLLFGIVPFEQPLVIHFPVGERPQFLFYTADSGKDYDRQIQAYLDGAFYLDPFYQLGLQSPVSGLFRLADIAPDNFFAGRFYREYYKAAGIEDELSFVQTLSDGSQLHLSLCRTSGGEHFQALAIAKLMEVVAVVNNLLCKHRELSQGVSGDSPGKVLSKVLQHFGSSVLTSREQMIVQLILRGHSSKSMAAKLGRSLSTIKHHRKQIYRKLDIHTEAELFHLFIDAAPCYSEGSQDSLQRYHESTG